MFRIQCVCVFSALVFVLMLSLLIVFGVSGVFFFFFPEEDHLDQDLDLEMIKLSSKFVRYLFV